MNRERRSEAWADLTELFRGRKQARGLAYALWRLLRDLLSLVPTQPRFDVFFQDARFGARLFRRQPGSVAIAICGLGAAIAAVTTVFAMVNVTLLRPYKMSDPSTVVGIGRVAGRYSPRSVWPYADYRQLQAASLTSIQASSLERVGIATTAASENSTQAPMLFVSGGYLPLLGGRASIGRILNADDDQPNAPPVIMLSRRTWMTAFGGSDAVIGERMWVNGNPATIVGVMDDAFVGPISVPPALWSTLSAHAPLNGGTGFTPSSREQIDVIGRLHAGVSQAAAQDELQAITARIDGQKEHASVKLYSSESPWDGPDGEENGIAVVAIFGVVALVLILACANAANWLLAGAVARAREIGVRLALGASRGRIVRQLVSESLVLGLAAGAVGLLLSIWLSPVIASLIRLPDGTTVSPDYRVYTFALLIALVSGAGAGIAPARFGRRGHVLAALHDQSTHSFGARRSRVRSVFVGLQAAVSLSLLAIAAMFMHSMTIVSPDKIGFDADRLLAVSFDVPRTIDQNAYTAAITAAAVAMPGVERVSLSQYAPFGGARWIDRVMINGSLYGVFGTESDEHFFATAGVSVLRGRSFTADEAATKAPVALIDEQIARDFFPGRDPIGLSVDVIPSRAGKQPAATIIGITTNTITSRMDGERFGMIYRPLRNTGADEAALLVRTAAPAALMQSLQRRLAAIEPRVRVSTTMVGDDAQRFFGGQRMMTLLASMVAMLALVLAVLGVYGVASFAIGQRLHEICIRVAVGASPADIRRLLIRQSLQPVAIGAAIGLALALAAAPILMHEMAGLSAHDPLSLITAAAAVLGGAIAAITGPARRAVAIDPISVLKR